MEIDQNNTYGVDEAWKHQFNEAEGIPKFMLHDFPEGDLYTKGLTLSFESGKMKGIKIDIIWQGGHLVSAKPDASGRNLEQLLTGVLEGDSVLVDNSDYIAVQTYHRHQVPGNDYPAWNQFKDDDENPIYPQRKLIIGPIMALGGAGSVQNGTPKCKMFIL